MTRDPESKLVLWGALGAFVTAKKAEGRRIVTTNGCFDVLHWGHIKYLSEAKKLGDLLICGINTDRSVKALGKAPNRPIHSEKIRALQIAGLESVDAVVIFDQDTPEALLEIVRPSVHVKGADYANKAVPERALVERHGGVVKLIPFVDGFSTTSILAKL